MKTKWKLNCYKVIAALCILVMSFTACGKSEKPEEPEKPDKSVNETAESLYAKDGQLMSVGGVAELGLVFNADFFSPFYQGSAASYTWPAMEPLAYYHSYDKSWRECLATEWERDTETSLTIKLTDKATWSDGSGFTSADVIATWDARFKHGTDSVIGSPTSYEAKDDYTVRIEWEKPSLQYEVWALCQPIYQAKAIQEHDTDWLNTNIVGTGPYVLTSFVPDKEIVYERREDYWGEPVGPDSIKFNYIKDSVAQLAAFVNGDIGSLSVRDNTTAVQLKQQGFEGVENETMGTNYYALIIAKDEAAPLSNAAVRRAIYMHGIDWQSFAKIAGGDIAFHTDMLGIPNMAYYDESLEQTDYDLEKCKQELADAGYPDGFSCNLYARSTTTVVATVLQESLKQLGIQAEVVMIDESLSFGKILADDSFTSGVLFGNFVCETYPQMDRFVKHFGPNATFGAAAECSAERLAAWEKASGAASEDEENEGLYEYVDLYVHEEAAIWPMYNTPVLNFTQSWYHVSPYVHAVSIVSDPHEIWVTEK